MKRYTFMTADGKVLRETNNMQAFFGNRKLDAAEFMQDRETGTRYEIGKTGPLVHRLKKVA